MTDLSLVKCFLLDLDGTVYLSGRPVFGAADAIERMRGQGRVLFITNNSSVSADDYFVKLNNMKIKAAQDEIVTSGTVTIDYLKKNHGGKRVYLLGTPSLKDEFKAAGIKLDSRNPQIVVLGFDKTLTYKKLERAVKFLRGGAFFVATHPDFTCPTDKGGIPDVGSFLALIKAAAGREPDIVCGKPFDVYAEYVKKITGCAATDIAVFGDRLSTDMRFAKENGFKAVLVLTGEATCTDAEGSPYKPDLVLESIAFWDK